MKDVREEWYDAQAKVAVTLVDVTSAAQALASGHLAGPCAAHYLGESLAAVALLGAEMSEPDETVILQMTCTGPLGGACVECTAAGTLRGYTTKKVLDDFDELTTFDDRQILGTRQYQVTRSVPGKILSQGVSNSLDGYLAGSLQRKACLSVMGTRGALIEALPDSTADVTSFVPEKLTLASRTIVNRLGLKASLKKTTPLAFACRCSAERAAGMLAALSEAERTALPPVVDITCHMCGRTFSIANKKG